MNALTQKQCDWIANELNNRPRERYAELSGSAANHFQPVLGHRADGNRDDGHHPDRLASIDARTSRREEKTTDLESLLKHDADLMTHGRSSAIRSDGYPKTQ